MQEFKAWYRSKTVWGSVVAIAAAVASMLGIQIDGDTQVAIVDAALQFITASGALVALFGRLTAHTMID